MNTKRVTDPKGISHESQRGRRGTVGSNSLTTRSKIITACVTIEFIAIIAALFGATPTVFWGAIGASTMSAFFAFVLAWKVFPPVGLALPTFNALTCFRLWSVPWLISAGGLSKYLLIVIHLVRVIGWVALLIINRRVRSFLETRFSDGDG